MIRLSMTRRFQLAGVFTIFLVFSFGLFAVYHLHALNEEIRSSLAADLKLANFAAEGREIFAEVRAHVMAALHQGRPQRLAEAIREIDRLRQHVRRGETTDSRLEASQSILLAHLDLYQQTLASATAAGPASDPALLFDLFDSQEEIAAALRALERQDLKILAADQGQIARATKALQTRMGILGILTVAGTIGLSFFFTQQIRLPIRRLRGLINAIRDGDYGITVRTDSDDDLGQVFEALAHMVQHIATRDRLKVEKILHEKNRFAALANHLAAPLLLLNAEMQVAFANNPCLEFFQLAWDDVYELPLAQTPLPIELKNRIAQAVKTQIWPVDESLDAIGENYAYEMHLTFIPVKDGRGNLTSLICLLGRPRA